MRKIKEIIIHCSATKEGRNYTVADIDRWHRERGFFCIGYHFVIYRDGSIHVGRSVEEVGAHCKGHNTVSIGVCYIGGLSKDGKPKDTRTSEQKAALKALIEQLKEEYPEATVHGHNEFAANQGLPLLRCEGGIWRVKIKSNRECSAFPIFLSITF